MSSNGADRQETPAGNAASARNLRDHAVDGLNAMSRSMLLDLIDAGEGELSAEVKDRALMQMGLEVALSASFELARIAGLLEGITDTIVNSRRL